MNKVYCIAKSKCVVDELCVFAFSQEGVVIATHISSSEAYAVHDIGVTSDWHHDIYRMLYPAGFEIEWLGAYESYDEIEKVLNSVGVTPQRVCTSDAKQI